MNYEHMSKRGYLFYILIHPVTGFEELKFNKKGSAGLANLLCALLCAAVIIKQVLSAFIFRTNRVEDINILWLTLGCVGMLLMFSLSNWLFCTLFDGKGKFSEIWVVSCYSMLPFIMVSIPLTVIGNAFTADEAFFYNALMALVIAWSGLLLFIGTMCVHQFTISKNILTLLATLVGIMIMLFILLLLFTLVRNVYTFIITVYNELAFRI